MKRNLLLVFALGVSLLLIVNGTKRILSLRTNSQKVAEAEARLETLRGENEALKNELEYKKSEEFTETEIRDKLGLAKPGEAVVVVPQDEKVHEFTKEQKPNYVKWKELFFGT
jgi:cell division protein FtsB